MPSEDTEQSTRTKISIEIFAYDRVRLADVSARVMRERFLETNSARKVTPADAVRSLIDDDETLRDRISELEHENEQLRDELDRHEASTSSGLFEARLKEGHQPGPDMDTRPERDRGARDARLA